MKASAGLLLLRLTQRRRLRPRGGDRKQRQGQPSCPFTLYLTAFLNHQCRKNEEIKPGEKRNQSPLNKSVPDRGEAGFGTRLQDTS